MYLAVLCGPISAGQAGTQIVVRCSLFRNGRRLVGARICQMDSDGVSCQSLALHKVRYLSIAPNPSEVLFTKQHFAREYIGLTGRGSSRIASIVA